MGVKLKSALQVVWSKLDIQHHINAMISTLTGSC